MTVEDYRQLLAGSTGHGWGFLAAYGLTWLACALAWRRLAPRTAAFCTLFQGLLALPLALLLTALTPGPGRPTMTGMDSLSIVLACSQLLGLPIVAYLLSQGRYSQVPLAMVILLVVHFAPYSWLYDTALYVVTGGVLSVSALVADAMGRRAAATEAAGEGSAAQRVCLTVGLVMVLSASIAVAIS